MSKKIKNIKRYVLLAILLTITGIDLGFQNKVCKDCTIKNGREPIPISMNMNRRNIISFGGMASGIFLIYIEIGIIGIILIIVCILLLLSKEGLEKSPYYEYIQK